MAIPIVDSHVHLWPQAHLPTIAWHSDDNPLGAQYSVDEYHSATNHSPLAFSSPGSASVSTYLRGFIYVEVDRISSTDEAGEHGWRHVLDEVSYVTRIATGNPILGEGHSASQRELLLAFVPWAPIPQGPAALERYMTLVRERTLVDEVWLKVRGVRYLVQDKPVGTVLTQDFVDSLKWLGKKKLAFDLGVDARQGGLAQLREAVSMMRRVYDGVDEREQVVIIIS
jgi:L-rhamnono-1,4-lactonase